MVQSAQPITLQNDGRSPMAHFEAVHQLEAMSKFKTRAEAWLHAKCLALLYTLEKSYMTAGHALSQNQDHAPDDDLFLTRYGKTHQQTREDMMTLGLFTHAAQYADSQYWEKLARQYPNQATHIAFYAEGWLKKAPYIHFKCRHLLDYHAELAQVQAVLTKLLARQLVKPMSPVHQVLTCIVQQLEVEQTHVGEALNTFVVSALDQGSLVNPNPYIFLERRLTSLNIPYPPAPKQPRDDNLPLVDVYDRLQQNPRFKRLLNQNLQLPFKNHESLSLYARPTVKAMMLPESWHTHVPKPRRWWPRFLQKNRWLIVDFLHQQQNLWVQLIGWQPHQVVTVAWDTQDATWQKLNALQQQLNERQAALASLPASRWARRTMTTFKAQMATYLHKSQQAVLEAQIARFEAMVQLPPPVASHNIFTFKVDAFIKVLTTKLENLEQNVGQLFPDKDLQRPYLRRLQQAQQTLSHKFVSQDMLTHLKTTLKTLEKSAVAPELFEQLMLELKSQKDHQTDSARVLFAAGAPRLQQLLHDQCVTWLMFFDEPATSMPEVQSLVQTQALLRQLAQRANEALDDIPYLPLENLINGLALYVKGMRTTTFNQQHASLDTLITTLKRQIGMLADEQAKQAHRKVIEDINQYMVCLAQGKKPCTRAKQQQHVQHQRQTTYATLQNLNSQAHTLQAYMQQHRARKAQVTEQEATEVTEDNQAASLSPH